MFGFLAGKIAIAVVIVLALLIISQGYVKAPPDRAYIISGPHTKRRILIGKAGIRIPFFERVDGLMLQQFSVDIKSNGYIPTKDYIGVDIDAIAKVQIDTSSPEALDIAARNFLNMSVSQIAEALSDSLQGNMREIVGTMDLRSISSDRKVFGDQVQEKAQVDMNNLGIRIISCNIQKVEDENGLINALGMDNMAQIQKDASIAKANADRDVAIAQAQAQKAANDERVAADLEIAEKQTDLAIRQAELKAQSEAKRAEAEAAYEIQAQIQQRSIKAETVNAEIAEAERTKELREKEVLVKQQELAATIERQADAEKYRAEREAEAALVRKQREAEAEFYARQKEAEAIRLKGEAEAEAIRAKGEAEAAAMMKQAEAYKEYNDAAKAKMMIDIMPEVARAIASPISAIDKVQIYGGDGQGISGLSGNVPVMMRQLFDTMTEATGVDMSEILKAKTYDAQVKKEISLTGAKEVLDEIVAE